MREIRIPAKVENLDHISSVFEEYMKEEGFEKKEIASINIAIEEVFVNIASYAYDSDEGDTDIKMKIHKNPKELELTFVDSGKPYNPLEKEDPDISMDVMDREIGGLGIFMVKEIMDLIEYEYKEGRNVLSMKKRY